MDAIRLNNGDAVRSLMGDLVDAVSVLSAIVVNVGGLK